MERLFACLLCENSRLSVNSEIIINRSANKLQNVKIFSSQAVLYSSVWLSKTQEKI